MRDETFSRFLKQKLIEHIISDVSSVNLLEHWRLHWALGKIVVSLRKILNCTVVNYWIFFAPG